MLLRAPGASTARCSSLHSSHLILSLGANLWLVKGWLPGLFYLTFTDTFWPFDFPPGLRGVWGCSESDCDTSRCSYSYPKHALCRIIRINGTLYKASLSLPSSSPPPTPTPHSWPECQCPTENQSAWELGERKDINSDYKPGLCLNYTQG